MRGRITEILSRELHKKGNREGWIVTAIVSKPDEFSGEEVTGWAKTGEEYQVGDLVTYYYDSHYGKAKMNKDIDSSQPL